MPEHETRSHLRTVAKIEHPMPTGSKIAAIVLVVLLAAAGLYYAFVAPPASNNTAALGSKNSSTTTNGNSNLPGGTAGLASQTPNTLTPSGFGSGTGTGTGTGTPTITVVQNGTGTVASTGLGTGGPAPVNTTGPGGTGINTNGGTSQPGFAPGSLGSAGTGKGDFSTPTNNGVGGALPAGGLSSNGTSNGTTVARPSTTVNGATGNNAGANNGFGPNTPVGSRTGTGVGGSTLAGGTSNTGNNFGGPEPVGTRSTGTGFNPASTTGTAPNSLGPVTTAPTAERTHVVVSGDSFSSISTKYFGTESKAGAIASANPLVDPTRMKIGAKLRIPEATTLTAAPPVVTPNGKSVNGSGTTVTASTSGNNHNVATGETLAAISRKYYGSSKYWQKLYAANKGAIGSNPANLKVGQKLTIPAKTTVVGGENVER